MLLEGPKPGFDFYTLLLRLYLLKIWIRRTLLDVSSRRGTSYTLNCSQYNKYHRHLPHGAKCPVCAYGYFKYQRCRQNQYKLEEINEISAFKSFLATTAATLSKAWFTGSRIRILLVALRYACAFFSVFFLFQCKACNGQILRRKSPAVCLQTGTRKPVNGRACDAVASKVILHANPFDSRLHNVSD